jgi:hypothetical protein
MVVDGGVYSTGGRSSLRVETELIHSLSYLNGLDAFNKQTSNPYILPSMGCESSRLNAGHIIIASSVFFFALASYAVLFSAFLPLSGVFVCHLLHTTRASF